MIFLFWSYISHQPYQVVKNKTPDSKEESLHETSFICGECTEAFENENDCNIHMEVHALPVSLKCDQCDFTSNTRTDIESHIQTIHMSIQIDLKESDQYVNKCGICNYTCKYNIQLKKHMKKHNTEATYSCNQCPFTTDFLVSAYEHTIAYHPEEADKLSAKESENLILKLVAEQTTSISNEISSLRSDT